MTTSKPFFCDYFIGFAVRKPVDDILDTADTGC